MAAPLPIADIVRLEADDNYTFVYVAGQPRPLHYGIALALSLIHI